MARNTDDYVIMFNAFLLPPFFARATITRESTNMAPPRFSILARDATLNDFATRAYLSTTATLVCFFARVPLETNEFAGGGVQFVTFRVPKTSDVRCAILLIFFIATRVVIF